MADSTVNDFDERLNGVDCPSYLRDIVGALRRHIESCGPVNWRAHQSRSGWGLRASVGGRIICRMDPKPVGGYVGVQVMDAEPSEHAAAGSVFLRKNAPSWVHLDSPDAATRLFPLISRAYDAASGRARVHQQGHSRQMAHHSPASSPPLAPMPPDTSDTRRALSELGFRHAGAIRPTPGRDSCVCDVEDVTGFLVYAHVVGTTVMKFGITTPSLRARMSQNARTINDLCSLANGTARPAKWHSKPFDRFKTQAPDVIRSGREIDVWVLTSSEAEYRSLERAFNARFETMEKGWTSQLG